PAGIVLVGEEKEATIAGADAQNELLRALARDLHVTGRVRGPPALRYGSVDQRNAPGIEDRQERELALRRDDLRARYVERPRKRLTVLVHRASAVAQHGLESGAEPLRQLLVRPDAHGLQIEHQIAHGGEIEQSACAWQLAGPVEREVVG